MSRRNVNDELRYLQEQIGPVGAGDNYSDMRQGNSGFMEPTNVDNYTKPLLDRGFTEESTGLKGRLAFKLRRYPYSYMVIVYTPSYGFQFSTAVRWALYKSGSAQTDEIIAAVAEGSTPAAMLRTIDKQLDSAPDNDFFPPRTGGFWPDRNQQGRYWYKNTEIHDPALNPAKSMDDPTPSGKLIGNTESDQTSQLNNLYGPMYEAEFGRKRR